MRGFDIRAVPLALAAIALGCSTRVLVPVDPAEPDPCADGGTVGCFSPDLLDGLIGYWRFEDGAGSAIAQDATLLNNDGTLYQLDPATTWMAGRSGDGVNVAAKGWIGVVPSPSIDSIDGQVTVAAWVNLEGTIMLDPGPGTTAGWATALSRQKGTTYDQHYHLALNIDAHPHLFIMPASGAAAITAPDPVTPRTWIHIAGSYDGIEARLYVNGLQVAHGAIAGKFAPDTTPVIIGGNGNGTSNVPTELFPGRLDEVMLYRRALTEDQIRQLAAGALFGVGVPRDAGARD